MTYLPLSFRRYPAQRYVLALLCVLVVGVSVLFAGKHSVELALASCLSVAGAGVFTIRGSVRGLFSSAQNKGRDMALLRTMAAASRQPFFYCCPVYGDDGSVIHLQLKFVNSAACRALGLSRRHLRGQTFSICLTPASYTVVLHQATEVLANGSSSDVPVFLTPKAGELEPYEVRLMPLSDGIAITALHSREEAEATRRAEAADQFTQSVFENAPVSIIATDAHGTIRAMNSAAEALTLYRRFDLVGVHSVLALHDAAELSSRSVELAQRTGEQIHPVSIR